MASGTRRQPQIFLAVQGGGGAFLRSMDTHTHKNPQRCTTITVWNMTEKTVAVTLPSGETAQVPPSWDYIRPEDGDRLSNIRILDGQRIELRQPEA